MEVELSEPGVNLKWLKNNAIINWSEVHTRVDTHTTYGFHCLKQSKIASNQVNCQKKDEIVNGKFISSIFFPNCEEDDTSYYSATILEFVANGAKDQTDCWFEVIPAT